MSSELRWILLIIGVVFIVGLALWERRRPAPGEQRARACRAARGARASRPAPARDSALVLPEMRAREPLSSSPQELPVVELADPERVPVLEARALAPPAAAPETGTASEAAAESANDTLPDPLAADDAVADALASAAPPGAAEDFAYVPKAAPARGRADAASAACSAGGSRRGARGAAGVAGCRSAGGGVATG